MVFQEDASINLFLDQLNDFVNYLRSDNLGNQNLKMEKTLENFIKNAQSLRTKIKKEMDCKVRFIEELTKKAQTKTKTIDSLEEEIQRIKKKSLKEREEMTDTIESIKEKILQMEKNLLERDFKIDQLETKTSNLETENKSIRLTLQKKGKNLS